LLPENPVHRPTSEEIESAMAGKNADNPFDQKVVEELLLEKS
jgi:hypothetical protein